MTKPVCSYIVPSPSLLHLGTINNWSCLSTTLKQCTGMPITGAHDHRVFGFLGGVCSAHLGGKRQNPAIVGFTQSSTSADLGGSVIIERKDCSVLSHSTQYHAHRSLVVVEKGYPISNSLGN